MPTKKHRFSGEIFKEFDCCSVPSCWKTYRHCSYLTFHSTCSLDVQLVYYSAMFNAHIHDALDGKVTSFKFYACCTCCTTILAHTKLEAVKNLPLNKTTTIFSTFQFIIWEFQNWMHADSLIFRTIITCLHPEPFCDDVSFSFSFSFQLRIKCIRCLHSTYCFLPIHLRITFGHPQKTGNK